MPVDTDAVRTRSLGVPITSMVVVQDSSSSENRYCKALLPAQVAPHQRVPFLAGSAQLLPFIRL